MLFENLLQLPKPADYSFALLENMDKAVKTKRIFYDATSAHLHGYSKTITIESNRITTLLMKAEKEINPKYKTQWVELKSKIENGLYKLRELSYNVVRDMSGVLWLNSLKCVDNMKYLVGSCLLLAASCYSMFLLKSITKSLNNIEGLLSDVSIQKVC